MLMSVLPQSALQIASVQGADGLHSIQTSGGGGTIVQYATQNQDGQFFVPGEFQNAIESHFFPKCIQNSHAK